MAAETRVDVTAWKAFWKQWEDVIGQIPKARREALEAAGREMLEAARRGVTSSGVRDARGRVRSWQAQRMGSGGGYTAVSPVGKTAARVTRAGKTTSVGAVTNFLESGHRVRGPSGRAKRYVPRARRAKVRGFGFYAAAKADAEKIAVKAAESALRKIKEELERG